MSREMSERECWGKLYELNPGIVRQYAGKEEYYKNMLAYYGIEITTPKEIKI